jgi:WD40 repeat protein
MWFYNIKRQIFAEMTVTTRKKTETKFVFTEKENGCVIFQTTLDEYCWADSGIFSPDGSRFYFTGDGKRNGTKIYNSLYFADMKEKTVNTLDLFNPGFGCSNICLMNTLTAYFKDEEVVIRRQDGIISRISQKTGDHHTLDISPDETAIAVSSGINPDNPENPVIRLFSIKDGNLIKSIALNANPIYKNPSLARIKYHPDGKTIFALGYHDLFKAVDAESGVDRTPLFLFPEGSSNDFHDIDISDNGKYLMLLTRNSKVLIFDLVSMKPLKMFPFPVMTKGYRIARFMREDGLKGYYFSSLDKKLEIFDIDPDDENGNIVPVPQWREDLEKLKNEIGKEFENKNYNKTVELLDKAWGMLPGTKFIYDESFYIAKDMIIACLRLKDYVNGKKWADIIFECDLERIDDGEREMLAGRVAYESGDLKSAEKYFLGAYKKSGKRSFQNEKYKQYFELIKNKI